MLNQQTVDQLLRMKLKGMSYAYQEQLQQPTQTSPSKNASDSWSIGNGSTGKTAGLKVVLKPLNSKNRPVSRISITDTPGGLDRSLFKNLVSCQWISKHQNLILIGPSGCGKTYLACALANQACRLGLTTLYTRSSKLLHHFQIAKADGSYSKLLTKLAKLNLLIIDDWGLNSPHGG